MVKFSNKKFLDDNNFPCMLVIDTDLQGLWDTGYLEEIKYAFPRVYSIYQLMCKTQYNKLAGRSIVIEDAGYTIGILFTKKHRKDDRVKTIKNFESAFDDLLRKTHSNVWIYSPIMGRKEKLFADYLMYMNQQIEKNKYNWFVYTK